MLSALSNILCLLSTVALLVWLTNGVAPNVCVWMFSSSFAFVLHNLVSQQIRVRQAVLAAWLIIHCFDDSSTSDLQESVLFLQHAAGTGWVVESKTLTYSVHQDCLVESNAASLIFKCSANLHQSCFVRTQAWAIYCEFLWKAVGKHGSGRTEHLTCFTPQSLQGQLALQATYAVNV